MTRPHQASNPRFLNGIHESDQFVPEQDGAAQSDTARVRAQRAAGARLGDHGIDEYRGDPDLQGRDDRQGREAVVVVVAGIGLDETGGDEHGRRDFRGKGGGRDCDAQQGRHRDGEVANLEAEMQRRVEEKERRLAFSMRAAGLRRTTHLLSWWLEANWQFSKVALLLTFTT